MPAVLARKCGGALSIRSSSSTSNSSHSLAPSIACRKTTLSSISSCKMRGEGGRGGGEGGERERADEEIVVEAVSVQVQRRVVELPQKLSAYLSIRQHT